MDDDFNIKDYDFKSRARFPVDNTFWAELSLIENVPFYIPSKRAKKGWPEKLRKEFAITEYVYYNPEIVGLPLTLTNEQIEEVRKGMNKNSPLPVNRAESISPQDALERIKIKLLVKSCASDMIRIFGDKESKPPIFSDWEKKVLSWRSDYGFLVPYQKMKGSIFPTPNGNESLKYEVVREYFFNIDSSSLLDPYFSGIILSLAQEPNTDKAIFGLRRDFRTDWIFSDKRFFDGKTAFVGGIYVNGKVKGGRSIKVDPFVEEINYLIRNLEDIIST